ncbi:MAG: septal ring lytic transglycosylase RlpA family protein [Bacteroidota bacterium]
MRLLYLAFVLISLPLPAQIIGDLETGLASYFSDNYAGAETAYGVTYRPTDLVGAHKTYPHNAVVRVRNLENGREVEVRIIDEGPFIRGRIIEVSRAAAERLGMIGKQTTQVEVRLVSLPDGRRSTTTAVAEEQPSSSRTTPPPAATPVPAPQTADRPVTVPSSTTPSTNRSASPSSSNTAASSAPAPDRPASPPTASTSNANERDLVTEGGFGPGLYAIQIQQGPTTGFGVQVASLSDLENAMTRVTELQGQWFDDILVRREGTGASTAYKIILGEFSEREAAAQYARDLKNRYRINGFVVPFGE